MFAWYRIVFSENRPARALYESVGYRAQADEPAIDVPGLREHGECLLLVRPTD
jgi:hypothetical protein